MADADLIPRRDVPIVFDDLRVMRKKWKPQADPLTREQLHSALHYDPETGVFAWLIRPSYRVKSAGVQAGTKDSSGYVLLSLWGRRYFAHRLAWFYMHGVWPQLGLDHINGDKADNRIANLRPVDQRMNTQNLRKAKASNKTGLLGVHMSGRPALPFAARLQANGKNLFLGRFKTAEEAHQAYLAAKRRLHEGCTI